MLLAVRGTVRDGSTVFNDYVRAEMARYKTLEHPPKGCNFVSGRKFANL